MINIHIRLFIVIWWLLACQSLHAALMAEHVLSINTGLAQPTDTAVASNGDIYVLHGAQSRVLVFSAQGKPINSFSRAGKGEGDLFLPMGISIKDQRVYIADTGNARIAVFDLHGTFVRNILLPDKNSTAGRSAPVSLLLMPDRIIWSDRENHRLCASDINDGKLLFCVGERGRANGEFKYPYQLVADTQGYIFAVDVLNARVQVLTAKGRHVMNVGHFGVGVKGGLFRPNGLALSAQGYLLVSDAYLGEVAVFKNGRPVALLSSADGELKFSSPTSLTLHENRLYVTDTEKNRIKIFILSEVPQQAADKKPATVVQRGRAGKSCVACHISWADNFDVQMMDTAESDEPVVPAAHQRMCYSCHHGVVIDSRQTIAGKYQHPDIHHRRENKKHSDDSDRIAKQFPLFNTQADKEKSKEKDQVLYCGSCHTPHKAEVDDKNIGKQRNNSWMREVNTGGELCQQCHQSKYDNVQQKKRTAVGVNHALGYFLKQGDVDRFYAKDKNLHKGLPQKMKAAGARLNNRQQMICQSCHKVHGSVTENLTVLKTAKAEMCVPCHQRHNAKDLQEARKKGVHPVNIKLDEPVKINGRKVEVVDCLSCHSTHDGKPGTALLRLDDKEGELCNVCHKDYKRLINTAHDLRLSAKESENRYHETPQQTGVCGSCHSMHQAEPHKFSLDATVKKTYQGKEKPLPRDQTCLNCHGKDGIADSAQVKYFGHPEKDLILRSDKKDMPLLDDKNMINEFGKIACVTCHNPHRWSAHKNIEAAAVKKAWQKDNNGNVLSRFLRRKKIQDSFCQDCHGIESKIKYKYYHLDLSR